LGNPQLKFCPSDEGSGFALRQGEILSELIQLETDIERLDGVDLRDSAIAGREIGGVTIPIEHPYAIVLSHECDLEQDFNNKPGSNFKVNQELPNILLCEAVDAYIFEHDPNYEDILQRKTESSAKKNFRGNKDSRFHLIEPIPPEYDCLGQGIPALAIVFKRHFTMPRLALYQQIEMGWAKRRARLKGPYVDDLCQRFHHFNGRIALPDQFDNSRPKKFSPKLTPGSS
jgi:hypothetical protein